MTAYPADSKDEEGDAKRKADRRRFENDLISMQADRTRLLRQAEAAVTDLRVLQKKYIEIGFEIKDKQAETKKSESNLIFLEEEIRVLKKKITSLNS
jgi:peptidoglycan hydrolase CwlO-like protein